MWQRQPISCSAVRTHLPLSSGQRQGVNLMTFLFLQLSSMDPDIGRVATRRGREYAGALAVLQLLLPGSGVIYYGDEIGMENAVLSMNETVDVRIRTLGKVSATFNIPDAGSYGAHTLMPDTVKLCSRCSHFALEKLFFFRRRWTKLTMCYGHLCIGRGTPGLDSQTM